MTLKLILSETRARSELYNKWNEQVEKILNNGIVWIHEDLIWERFSRQNEDYANNPRNIVYSGFEKLEEMNQETIYCEILNAYNSIVQEFI